MARPNTYPHKTSFPAGAGFMGDSDAGVFFMEKNPLLALTSQNALAGNVAKDFNTIDDFGKGELVSYDGKTYRFKVDHSAGAWNSSEVEQISLTDKLYGYDNTTAHSETVSVTFSTSQSSYTYTLATPIPAGTSVKVSAGDFGSITGNLSLSVRFRDSNGDIIGNTQSIFPNGEVICPLDKEAVSFGFYRYKDDIVQSGTVDFVLDYETGARLVGDIEALDEKTEILDEQATEMFGKPAVIEKEEHSFAMSSSSSNYLVNLDTPIPAGKTIILNIDDYSALISGVHSINWRLRDADNNIVWQQSVYNGKVEIPPQAKDIYSVYGYISKTYISTSGKAEWSVEWEKVAEQKGILTDSVKKVDFLYGTESKPVSESLEYITKTDSVNYQVMLEQPIPAGKIFTITCGDITGVVQSGHGFGYRPAFADNSYVDTKYLLSGESVAFGPYDKPVVSIRAYLSTSYVIAVGSAPFSVDWDAGEYGEVRAVREIAESGKRYGGDVLRANHADETFASMASTFTESLFNFGAVNSGKRIELRRVLKGVMNGSQGAGCTSDGLCVVMSDSQYHKQLAFIDMNHFKVLQSGKFDQNNVNYHNNSLFFGTEKYDVSDPYPLLYASQGKNTEHCILVYRILVNDGVYSLDLVQTITLPDVSSNYKLSAGDSFLGNDGYLWVVGLDRTDPDNVTEYVIAKFTMPTLSQGDVSLTENDALDYYTLPYVATAQGGCIGANGYLYKMRSSGIIVIDLQNHLQLDAQSMYMQGYEIESCFFHNGTMYINAIEDASLTESGLDETDIWQVKFIKG